jgi:hypothetical protein
LDVKALRTHTKPPGNPSLAVSEREITLISMEGDRKWLYV